jgi:hypothetical protein
MQNPKVKKRQEEESDGVLSSNNSLMRDMGGPDPHKGLVNHFINMPRATTTVNPGENTLGVGAGPSATDASPLPSPAFRLRDDFSSSASSLLQPPTRDDNSSSASSRGSKRHREASPQPPRCQNRPDARTCHESPPRRPAAPEQQIHMLQQQIRHHQDEIQTLRTQASQEYHVGFTHGHSRGFEEAMSMSLGGGPSANPGDPSTREPREPRNPCNRCEDWEHRGHREMRDPDEAEAEDLRHTIHDLVAKFGSPDPWEPLELGRRAIQATRRHAGPQARDRKPLSRPRPTPLPNAMTTRWPSFEGTGLTSPTQRK